MEAVRWNMASDIPWTASDGSKLSDEQAHTIKMNAITEWAALPATEMFLRDNRGDSDFCAFMSVWFFEEQKHSLVLIEYLRRFRPELMPTEEELHKGPFRVRPGPGAGDADAAFLRRDPAEPLVPLRRRLAHRAGDQGDLPHGRQGRGAPCRRLPAVHAPRALHDRGDQTSLQARQSFAKIGVLMASASRTAQAMHPTNLHVNKALFPNDTVRVAPARAGLAGALARHPDRFDGTWEGKVATRILHILSKLLDRQFDSVRT